MFGKLKEMQANAQSKQEESLDKAQESMNTIHRENAEKHLVIGEEIIQCYGLLLDFACITNKRIFFVDAKLTSNKKKVVSIPYHAIHAVECDYGTFRGEVEIITAHDKYELKMGVGLAERFAKDILTQMFK